MKGLVMKSIPTQALALALTLSFSFSHTACSPVKSGDERVQNSAGVMNGAASNGPNTSPKPDGVNPVTNATNPTSQNPGSSNPSTGSQSSKALVGTWTYCGSAANDGFSYKSYLTTLVFSDERRVSSRVQYFQDTACKTAYTKVMADADLKVVETNYDSVGRPAAQKASYLKEVKDGLTLIIAGSTESTTYRADAVQAGTVGGFDLNGQRPQYLSYKIVADRFSLTNVCWAEELNDSRRYSGRTLADMALSDGTISKGCGDTAANRSTDFTKGTSYAKAK